jgi:hypothetical protein
MLAEEIDLTWVELLFEAYLSGVCHRHILGCNVDLHAPSGSLVELPNLDPKMAVLRPYLDHLRTTTRVISKDYRGSTQYQTFQKISHTLNFTHE